MANRTGPTNENLRKLILELKMLSSKEKVNIWKRIAYELKRAKSTWRAVNISKINKYTKENESVIVPGKVLATGDLDHKVNVAAFNFSQSAEEKINKIGKAILIKDLIKQNPKGNGLRIIG